MSCQGAILAEPMLDSEQYLEEYAEQLVDLQKSGKLPNLLEKLNYNVYSVCGSSIDAHKSIVLSSNNIDFVTVELGFYTLGDRRHVKPVARALDSSLWCKLDHIGTVKTTGVVLIAKVVEAMKKFGGYSKFCHNCHDFCGTYLASIGLARGGNKELFVNSVDAKLMRVLTNKLLRK